MSDPRLNFLPWDSEFFGIRVGRFLPPRLKQDDLPIVQDWTRQNAIDCLYFLAEPRFPETLAAAHQGGFKFVDSRVEFELPEAQLATLETQTSSAVRPATAEDESVILSIARTVHTNTRFFKDSMFRRERSAELYAEWLRGALRDPGQAVFVSVDQANVARGYVSCGVAGTSGRIGLIGVEESFRGHGFASRLLHGANLWCAAHGARTVHVASQADNSAAANLYSAAGFRQTSIAVWFHRWSV